MVALSGRGNVRTTKATFAPFSERANPKRSIN